ncbi:hypothetical protein D9758_018944 [Tetrapyrgos nigripes]|uniref:Homeobox domain-containing protein n=1 Tax=Tetrapyrgos nigripes TaxID=182062 RepID=A0A8H5AVH8_9AGAR|nr:hypothetical protein D9758_018944 [Tetrapyrgos nigripes]
MDALDTLLPAHYSPRPLSRSDSMTSVESDGYDPPATVGPNASRDPSSRRTRKRFNSVQLMMLENMFHHNSHPSRQERETLAKAGEMEMKSVTIWFQNKRQTERRGAEKALNNNTNRTSSRNGHTFHNSGPSTRLSARPSLDRVASLSELPEPVFSHEPRTPTRPRIARSLSSDTIIVDQDGSIVTTDQSTSSQGNNGSPDSPSTIRIRAPVPIWESMPSSPPVPFTSPPAREFVEFGKLTRTKTLEWACARQRMAGKDKEAGSVDIGHDQEEDDDEVELRIMRKERKESSSKRSKHHKHDHNHRHHEHRDHSDRRHSSSHSSRLKSNSLSSSSTSKPRRYRSASEGDDAKKALQKAYHGDRKSLSRASSSSVSAASASVSGEYDHGQTQNSMTMSRQGSTAVGMAMDEDDDVMRAALALCGLGGRR